MRTTTAGLALLAALLTAPDIGMAQSPQGSSGQTPQGNLQSGAAMNDAQRRSSGTPDSGTATQPPSQTHSPRPSGAADTPARQRPEGNLGSGAAMTGSQRQSTGAPATGGAPPAR
jgi:hypothetical protein